MSLERLNWDKILQAYKEELIGKKFVYFSKYGGHTFGEITDVYNTTIITWDSETTKQFAWTAHQAKSNKPLQLRPTHNLSVPKFSGSNNRFQIRSSKGNSYELSEISILSKGPIYIKEDGNIL